MKAEDPIALLFAAALGEEAWEDALAVAARSIGGAVILVGAADVRRPESLEYWCWDYDIAPLRAAGFRDGDLWDPKKNRCVRAGMVMPLHRSADHRVFFSDQTFLTDPFLRHCMVSQDIVKTRMFVLARDDELLAGGFATRRGGAAIAGEDAERLDRLLPQIARALRLHRQINRDRQIAEALYDLIDRLSLGVVVVSRDLRILSTNKCAERLLAARDGIASDRRRFRVTSTQHQKALERNLAKRERESAEVVMVPRPCGGSLVLNVFPACGLSGGPATGAAFACITISDPLAPDGLLDLRQIQATFGLSPAEALVAQLVPLALTKRQVADRLGLSENTVKTHLAGIREKLGARSVNELGMMLARLPLANRERAAGDNVLRACPRSS
jgi:DNA-binding CsgD family transcriptional regulator